MKKTLKFWLLLALCLSFSLCFALSISAEEPCEHQSTPTMFDSATCEKPKTCRLCGETEGEALGHYWAKATCTAPRVCSTCGKYDGDALGHKWTASSCTTASVCSVCSKEGTVKGHVYDNSCDDSCNVCGEVRQINHVDLDSNSLCDLCNKDLDDGLNGGEIGVIILLPLLSIAAGVGVYFLLTTIKKKRAQAPSAKATVAPAEQTMSDEKPTEEAKAEAKEAPDEEPTAEETMEEAEEKAEEQSEDVTENVTEEEIKDTTEEITDEATEGVTEEEETKE